MVSDRYWLFYEKQNKQDEQLKKRIRHLKEILPKELHCDIPLVVEDEEVYSFVCELVKLLTKPKRNIFSPSRVQKKGFGDIMSSFSKNIRNKK